MSEKEFMKAVIEHELTVEETAKFLMILKSNNLLKGGE